MRRTVTAFLAATAAVPLSFLAAAPASAAYDDVTAEFTTYVNAYGGNTVVGTFTAANGVVLTECNYRGGFPVDFESQFPLFGLAEATADRALPNPLVILDRDVPDGRYVVEWGCTDGNEWWGTEFGVAEPTVLVVPVPTVEPEPDPACTGSVCLPTRSFGF